MIQMNNKEYKFDKKQNRIYSILAYISILIGIIIFIPLIDLIVNYISHLFNGSKITEHSNYYYMFLLIPLIIFIINIFVMKKLKLSNVKYYIFNLNKKIEINKVGIDLKIIDNREIELDNAIVKRVKLNNRKYRLLIYTKELFDKKEFDKTKKEAHKKYNREFKIAYQKDLVLSGKYHDEGGGRVNLILPKKMNDRLDEYMSLHATGLGTGIGSIYIAVIDDMMYVQPIKKFILFPVSVYYFGTIKRVYKHLNK